MDFIGKVNQEKQEIILIESTKLTIYIRFFEILRFSSAIISFINATL